MKLKLKDVEFLTKLLDDTNGDSEPDGELSSRRLDAFYRSLRRSISRYLDELERTKGKAK